MSTEASRAAVTAVEENQVSFGGGAYIIFAGLILPVGFSLSSGYSSEAAEDIQFHAEENALSVTKLEESRAP